MNAATRIWWWVSHVLSDLAKFTASKCISTSRKEEKNNIFNLSTLGMAFKMAAEQAGVRFRHSGFETSVLEIESNNYATFVEELFNVMD